MKALIKEVDNDCDGMISLRDFIILFRRRNKGELLPDSATSAIVNIFNATVNVREVGVGGAKAFFEGRAKLNKSDLAIQEIKSGAEQRKEIKAEKIKRHEQFESKRSMFGKPTVPDLPTSLDRKYSALRSTISEKSDNPVESVDSEDKEDLNTP